MGTDIFVPRKCPKKLHDKSLFRKMSAEIELTEDHSLCFSQIFTHRFGSIIFLIFI